jgi:hypothetical protein
MGRRRLLSKRQRRRSGLATIRGSQNRWRGGEGRCPDIVKIHRRVIIHLLILQIILTRPSLHEHMVDAGRWVPTIVRGRTVWGGENVMGRTQAFRGKIYKRALL